MQTVAFVAAVVGSVVSGVTLGQVTITSGQAAAGSTAISGRAGSIQGPVEDRPGPTLGTTGFVGAGSIATAGPVPPSEPPSPSLPGTNGVSTNASRGGVVFTDRAGGVKVVQCYASTLNDFRFMDGGTYQAFGSASFEVDFTVSSPTPYRLTGEYRPDDQDSVALVRLDGAGYLYFGAHGPYSTSGTLSPGDYTLRSGVTVYEVPLSNTGAFSERGLITANLVLGSTEAVCQPDIGQQGGLPGADGLLDNNDFIAFINYYFAFNPLADMGQQGGFPGGDGYFDNNDFIAFINLFFGGC